MGDHPFHDPDDILFGDEGHLHIDLREFRLTVRPEVLVAEAFDDLKIAVESGNHQQLLEDLRRLGEGVKHPLIHPAGDQVIAGPFRRALRQKGGFHLDESLAVKIVPRRGGDAAPQNQVLLDLGTPEIEVAVLETDVFGDLRRSIQHKGRRLRLVEDLQVIGQHLDLAGLQIGIFHPLRSSADRPVDGQNEFAPDPSRPLSWQAALTSGLKTTCDKSFPVPQIDKDDAAVIPAPVSPAHQDHFLPGMGCIDISAVMGSFRVGQKVGQVVTSLSS